MLNRKDNIKEPFELVLTNAMSDAEKVSALKEWAIDEHNQMVAAEEGMLTDRKEYHGQLNKILQALELFDADYPIEQKVPSK